MQTDEQIRDKVKARDAAEALVELIFDEMQLFRGEPAQSFQFALKGNLASLIPELFENPVHVDRDEPMTKEEVAVFDQTEIPFGKHCGELVQDHLRYLDYLCSLPDFRREAERYLMSKPIQRRLNDDEE